MNPQLPVLKYNEKEEMVEKILKNDQKKLEFSSISEHCHQTNQRETGISSNLTNTVSTCFITMLHLANDKNLMFDLQDDDFLIQQEIFMEKKEE